MDQRLPRRVLVRHSPSHSKHKSPPNSTLAVEPCMDRATIYHGDVVLPHLAMTSTLRAQAPLSQPRRRAGGSHPVFPAFNHLTSSSSLSFLFLHPPLNFASTSLHNNGNTRKQACRARRRGARGASRGQRGGRVSADTPSLCAQPYPRMHWYRAGAATKLLPVSWRIVASPLSPMHAQLT